MADIPFFRSRMGQRFYEHTMPELVRQLTRLNDLLERGAAPAPRSRFVLTCVPRDAGDGDWFVVDREDEEPAVLVGRGPEGRRRAAQLARELEDAHGVGG